MKKYFVSYVFMESGFLNFPTPYFGNLVLDFNGISSEKELMDLELKIVMKIREVPQTRDVTKVTILFFKEL